MSTHIRGWRSAVVFAVVLLVVAGKSTAQTPSMKSVAMVNGEPISMADVKAVLDTVPPPVVPPSADQKREMQQTVLDMLIDDLVMRQFLRKHTALPRDAEIDREIVTLKAALEKKKTTWAAYLKESNETEAQLRRDIACRLQWQAYLATQVNDAALKAYYQANKPFFDKITVRASHILLKVAPGTSAADKQAAQTKLQAIRQEIVAGKLEFAEAAKRFSDCPSKQDGGDLGGPFRFKFDVLEPFAQAAFSLKVGEISEVVQTESGMHLIKVAERSPGEPSTFETIKDQVREVLSMEFYQQIVANQRKAAQIQVTW
jgi:parvulin-like peptidyl-prolyl isomerase